MSFPLPTPLESFKQLAWKRRAATAAGVTRANHVERLEPRQLLAATITDRVLVVTGGGGNDIISLTRSGLDDVVANVNGATDTFDMDDFDSVLLSGVGGNDRVQNANGIENVTLDGGSGNDRIADGNGDNTLVGVGGDDFLSPGSGDDHLSGGSGTDTVNYATHVSGLHFSLTSFFTDGPTVSRTGETDTLATFQSAEEDDILDTEHFIGTAFEDNFIYRASESDSATGFPTITMGGRGGNDRFSNGGIFDSFAAIGGSGDDRFNVNPGGNGSAAETTLIGGDGNDIFDFDDDTGPDVIDGGAGNDVITLDSIGTPLVVDLNDFNGVEDAVARRPGVLLIGTPAANFLQTTNGGTIQGGDGNDTLFASGGDASQDTLLGEGGNDLLDGGTGDDVLDGGTGDDVLSSGGGADSLSGGAGRDTADYSSRNNALFIKQNDTLANDGEAGENDLVGTDVERVVGGSGNDSFVGNALNNTYIGGDGDDTMSGFDGADALQGQGGNDLLVGGNASDFLDGGSGDDDMYGQAGNDTLFGQGGNDRLFSNDGARDTVNGGSGTDEGTVDGLDVVTSVETT